MTGLPLHLLKRHSISIEAHFDFTFVLTYAFPQELLQPLLPPGLILDCHEEHAFVAVAFVQTSEMRPKGWPKSVAQSFFLVGYRIFTRYKTAAGQTLRGLKILRSDTDRQMMVYGGNLLTHYKYQLARVEHSVSNGELAISVQSDDGYGDVSLKAYLETETIAQESIPPGSVFTSVRDAMKFAGPLPFTFDYESETHSIIRVEGVRANWHPQAVRACIEKMSFFDQSPYNQVSPIFCSAFYLNDVPYYWKTGIRERLGKQELEKSIDSAPSTGRGRSAHK